MLADLTVMDLVGIVGSLTICTAYFAVSTGRMAAESVPYQLMNAGGAVLLLLSLYHRPNPGAILIEAIWLVIAIGALVRLGRRG